jgi:hypothetical protein
MSATCNGTPCRLFPKENLHKAGQHWLKSFMKKHSNQQERSNESSFLQHLHFFGQSTEEVKTVRPLEHLLLTPKINQFSDFCNSLLILKNHWPSSTDSAASAQAR